MPGSSAAVSPSPPESPSEREMNKEDVVGPLVWRRNSMTNRRASLADEANATGSFRARVAINTYLAGNDGDEAIHKSHEVGECEDEASATGTNEMTSQLEEQQTPSDENVQRRRPSRGSDVVKGRKRFPFFNGFFRGNTSSKMLSSTSTVETTPGSMLGDYQDDAGFATPSNTETMGSPRGSSTSWDGSADGDDDDDCESDAEGDAVSSNGLLKAATQDTSGLPDESNRRGVSASDTGMREPPEVLYFRRRRDEEEEDTQHAADEAEDPAQRPPHCRDTSPCEDYQEVLNRHREASGLERSNAQYQEGRDLFRQGHHREALSAQLRALQSLREAKVARELRKQRRLTSMCSSWDGTTSLSCAGSLEMSMTGMTQTTLVSVQSQGSRGLETTEMTIEAEEARIRYELAKIRLILHGVHQNDDTARSLRRELYEWAAQGYEEDLILKRRRIQGRRSRAVEVASICHTLGRLYDEKLGAYDDALRSYREALNIETQLLAEVMKSSTPRKRKHIERLTAMVQDTKRVMGKIHYKKGEFDLAMKLSFS